MTTKKRRTEENFNDGQVKKEMNTSAKTENKRHLKKEEKMKYPPSIRLGFTAKCVRHIIEWQAVNGGGTYLNMRLQLTWHAMLHDKA